MTTPPQEPQDWDPRAPEALADQRAAYDAMRERCPVAHSDAMHWSLFRHADVVAVLADPETFINSSRHMAIPNAMNGPEHARHRRELARYFTDAEMAAVEPRCERIAAETLDGIAGAAMIDAVADVAEPIALRAMCAFLGWPDAMWPRVRAWIHGNREATFRRDRDAAHRLAEEYATMVTDALAEHRAQGNTDDITGRLMQTEIDGQRWSDAEIVATLRNWVAGHGTVAATIGIVIARLAEDAALQRRLRERPELIPAAVDEIPRADGPLVANSRTTTRPVAIGGREIPAGERISLMWIAANRDPEAFTAPDEIRLERDQRGNLLYGAGIHYCLGAPLARLELRSAVAALLERTTGFRVSPDASLPRETFPGNGFMTVPLQVTWA